VTDEDPAEAYLGKLLLIGLSILDEDDVLLERFETYGPIVVADAQQIVIEKADGSGRYAIPPVYDSLEEAEPGDYRLRSSGETVSNPDFTASFDIICPEGDSIASAITDGFLPPEADS